MLFQIYNCIVLKKLVYFILYKFIIYMLIYFKYINLYYLNVFMFIYYVYIFRERLGIKYFQGIRYNKVFFNYLLYNLFYNFILSCKIWFSFQNLLER